MCTCDVIRFPVSTEFMRGRVHMTVDGRVQGVCFRMATKEEAVRLGLTGWVRNLRDGRVEIVAEGDQAAIIDLVATGATLKENGLEEVETIYETTARFVANRVSLKTNFTEIKDIALKLKAAVDKRWPD